MPLVRCGRRCDRLTSRLAEERLSWLRDHGPTAYAFTFKQSFAAPGDSVIIESDANWFCRA